MARWHRPRVVEPMKTNAVRILDKLGIHYELRRYEVDPDDLSAEKVARDVDLPLEKVFKTLVLQGDRHGVLLAVLPGGGELNRKALARLSDDRKIEMVPSKQLRVLTGYVRGGVTALACKKDYPVYVDELVETLDVIAVSAGVRGMQILLAPEDYLRATKATVGPIVRRKESK